MNKNVFIKSIYYTNIMPLVKINNELVSILIVRENNDSGIYLCRYMHKKGLVSIHRDNIIYNDHTCLRR